MQRLNVDGRGELLGDFRAEDQLLVVNQRGFVKVIPPEMNTHFDDDLIKFNMKSNAVLAIIATFAMKPFSTFFTKINMTSDL